MIMTDKNLNAYSFTFNHLQTGEELPLSYLKDRVILIVNTASQCGFTKQYDSLEGLYKTYHSEGLTVLGVPSNDFGQQEPGTSSEIDSFCKINYGVTFPMTRKECVVGDHAHPFYLWAKDRLGWIAAPKWNFHKYLINRHGMIVDYFISSTTPDSKKITETIEKLLEEK
jgi:glutathione peroxidase